MVYMSSWTPSFSFRTLSSWRIFWFGDKVQGHHIVREGIYWQITFLDKPRIPDKLSPYSSLSKLYTLVKYSVLTFLTTNQDRWVVEVISSAWKVPKWVACWWKYAKHKTRICIHVWVSGLSYNTYWHPAVALSRELEDPALFLFLLQRWIAYSKNTILPGKKLSLCKKPESKHLKIN